MQQNSKPSFQTLAIISAAMHFSAVILVFLVFFLSQTEHWENNLSLNVEENFGMIYFVLATVAIINAMLCLYWPAIASKIKNPPNAQNDIEMSSGEVPRKSLFLNYSNVDERITALTIVRLALGESIVILGFVGAFLGQSAFLILPFALAGLALQIVFGPIVGKILSK